VIHAGRRRGVTYRSNRRHPALAAAILVSLRIEMKTKKARKSARVFDWVIVRVRGARGERLGTVSAPTREAAIEQAMEDFNVAPIDRKRLIARASWGTPKTSLFS
jgi:hypothetical protein